MWTVSVEVALVLAENRKGVLLAIVQVEMIFFQEGLNRSASGAVRRATRSITTKRAQSSEIPRATAIDASS
jgi:hypothetical protein